MRALLILLMTYFVLGLESPLLQQLDVSPYAPNLGVVSVIFTAWACPGLLGLLTVFCIGLLQDGFSMGTPVGMNTEIFVLVFLTLRPYARKMNLFSLLPLMLLTIVVSLASTLLFFALTAIFDRAYDDYSRIFSMMIGNAFATAPFAPVIMMLYAWVIDRVGPRRGRELYFSQRG